MSPREENHSSILSLMIVFTVPGDGNIDFKSVLALVGHQYSGWIVVEAGNWDLNITHWNMRKR